MATVIYSNFTVANMGSNTYSKVSPLRNCVMRNSGLMLLNKIPSYKKISRLIQPQFLSERYIVTLYDLFIEYVFVAGTEKCLIALKDSKRNR